MRTFIALAVSRALPPPMPTMPSIPSSLAMAAPFSILHRGIGNDFRKADYLYAFALDVIYHPVGIPLF